MVTITKVGIMGIMITTEEGRRIDTNWKRREYKMGGNKKRRSQVGKRKKTKWLSNDN